MNSVVLMGRLTRDPEVRYSQGAEPMAVARFTLAVDRWASKNRNGEEETADFFQCVCFKGKAEFAEKYLRKGIKIAVKGSAKTGSYTAKDGRNVPTFTIVCDEIEFAEKKAAGGAEAAPPPTESDGFMNIPDGDEELPFH